jgi:phospholipase C
MTRLPLILTSVLLAVAAALLAGLNACGGASSSKLHQSAQVQRVVVIFQENRSTDNLFQGLCIAPYGSPSACGTGQNQYNIAQSGLSTTSSTPIPLQPLDLGTAGSNPDYYDLDHSHSGFVDMYNGGLMNGANLIPVTCDAGTTNCPPPNLPANPQYMYVSPADVAPYLTLAQTYTFGDNMFQTNQGPSFPAHQFILSGTSQPGNGPEPDWFVSSNVSPGTEAGCIAPAGSTVTLIDPSGNENLTIYPCFEHPTLTDLLDQANVTWRYYAPSAGSIWTAPDAINHICQPQTQNGQLVCTGPDWTANVSIPPNGGPAQILSDIVNGQLAEVSWVIPTGQESDHAGINDGSGPSWVASVVNAIGNSPYWANTVIFIAWDDWGGWYDHVAPTVINSYEYGFRVPVIVISPYARAAYISHDMHNFGSILKFIEETYGLPSLGYADSVSDDFSDCFNFSQTPLTFQTIQAPVPADYFLHDPRPPADPDDD